MDLVHLVVPPLHTPPPPPKVATPAPPPPPEIKMTRLEMPAPKPLLPAPTVIHVHPVVVPKPVVVKTEAAKLDLPKVEAPTHAPVQLNSFATPKSVAPVANKSLETTGFGDPQSPLPSHSNHGNVAASGFAQAEPGPVGGATKGAVASAGFGTMDSHGSDRGSSRAGMGGVANAGFGAATSGGGTGNGPAGQVRDSGFGVAAEASAPVAARAPEAPHVTPVEIISKPDPTYTAEARQLRIEGEVILAVVFGADGKLQVERVVRGLGHGLDQAAIQAAEAMQFHPAMQSGAPISTKATIHVSFQLAQ